MAVTSFEALALDAPLLRALDALGFATPTPIQAAAIPPLLDGRDLIGLAETGSGKTAAFTLPLLQNLARDIAEEGWRPGPTQISALILAPTRELAVQIHETIETLGKDLGLKTLVILGGVARRPQEKALAKGADILVGTPGRILDLVSTKHLSLREVTDFVLDEADRMLDMGFIHDVRKVVAHLPKERQTAMFSATWPSDVADLAARLLHEPETVEAGERKTKPTPDRIAQRVIFVEPGAARSDALRRIFENRDVSSAIVFTRTKRGANRVAETLEKAGVNAAAIHGNKSQNARQRALNEFKDGSVRALVATDIAARGVDVKGVTHVVNFDMPDTAEAYVHRIGRTARAGATGAAISLCGGDELGELKAIERLIGFSIDKEGARPEPIAAEKPGRRSNGRRGGGGSGGGGRSSSAKPSGEAPRTRKRRRPKRAA